MSERKLFADPLLFPAPENAKEAPARRSRRRTRPAPEEPAPTRPAAWTPAAPRESYEERVAREDLERHVRRCRYYGVDPSRSDAAQLCDAALARARAEVLEGVSFIRGRFAERAPDEPGGWRYLPVPAPHEAPGSGPIDIDDHDDPWT